MNIEHETYLNISSSIQTNLDIASQIANMLKIFQLQINECASLQLHIFQFITRILTQFSNYKLMFSSIEYNSIKFKKDIQDCIEILLTMTILFQIDQIWLQEQLFIQKNMLQLSQVQGLFFLLDILIIPVASQFKLNQWHQLQHYEFKDKFKTPVIYLAMVFNLVQLAVCNALLVFLNLGILTLYLIIQTSLDKIFFFLCLITINFRELKIIESRFSNARVRIMVQYDVKEFNLMLYFLILSFYWSQRRDWSNFDRIWKIMLVEIVVDIFKTQSLIDMATDKNMKSQQDFDGRLMVFNRYCKQFQYLVEDEISEANTKDQQAGKIEQDGKEENKLEDGVFFNMISGDHTLIQKRMSQIQNICLIIQTVQTLYKLETFQA